MKNFVPFILITFTIVLASCERESILKENEIPAEITAYISQHFSNHKILQSVKDRDNFELTYDIILSEGVTLEFNRKKEIISIDGNAQLPESAIPSQILTYVNAQYPGDLIQDWEIADKQNQEIRLSNGLELIFNKSGEFLRIDN